MIKPPTPERFSFTRLSSEQAVKCEQAAPTKTKKQIGDLEKIMPPLLQMHIIYLLSNSKKQRNARAGGFVVKENDQFSPDSPSAAVEPSRQQCLQTPYRRSSETHVGSFGNNHMTNSGAFDELETEPKQEELRTRQRCVTWHLIRVKSASVLRIMILHILYSMRNLSETEMHPETVFQKTWESGHTRWSNLIAQSQLDSRNQHDRKCFEKTAHRPICQLPHIDCLCLALLGSHIWATPRSIKGSQSIEDLWQQPNVSSLPFKKPDFQVQVLVNRKIYLSYPEPSMNNRML